MDRKSSEKQPVKNVLEGRQNKREMKIHNNKKMDEKFPRGNPETIYQFGF